MELVPAMLTLRRAVERLNFAPPVAYVYNPLDYAWHHQETYLRRFGHGSREILLLGMNPGPFGMVQTGIPFGEISSVREWLGISGPVDPPLRFHPRRPVEGFACRRREVSGARLWGWARKRFGTPERFFARFFVLNYCPLAFVEDSGRNRTPDKLPAEEREPLFAACDSALLKAVETLRPRWVLGVGKFAAERAKEALSETPVSIGSIPHPSPANPAANRDWAGAAEAALGKLGIGIP